METCGKCKNKFNICNSKHDHHHGEKLCEIAASTK